MLATVLPNFQFVGNERPLRSKLRDGVIRLVMADYDRRAHQSRRLRLDLPSNAIGKDHVPLNSALGHAPSGTGVQVSLLGLLGVIVAPEEGLEFNVLGLSLGVDVAEPALRLPGLGRIGPAHPPH